MGVLKAEHKAYLLKLKPEDITFDELLKLFGDRVDGKTKKMVPSMMHTGDSFVLEANEYFNKEKVTTNPGLFIYNKLIIERELSGVLGYWNTTIDGGQLGKIEDLLSKALLNDVINEEAMFAYLNRTQWLSMQLHSVVSGSFTLSSLEPLPKVTKRRNELINQHKDLLEAGDVVTSVKIEKELLDMADKELAKDHGLDLYRSGARGSFGNNFKTISVMKGAVYNPTTARFDIVTSNFMEGIKKSDLPVYGNSVVTAAYPKAIGTATSGYFSKQIIAALQAVVLDAPGSDCGTKGTLSTRLTAHNIKDHMYRYVVESGKTVLLDENNIDKYVGKDVKLRSVMYCVGEKKCEKCSGLMYRKLKIDNMGMTASRISSTLLNMSMKKFHDTSSKLYTVKKAELTI